MQKNTSKPLAIVSRIDLFKSVGHFYHPKHRIIFRAILDLFEKNEPPDITTVADELTKAGDLDGIGGRLYCVSWISK